MVNCARGSRIAHREQEPHHPILATRGVIRHRGHPLFEPCRDTEELPLARPVRRSRVGHTASAQGILNQPGRHGLCHRKLRPCALDLAQADAAEGGIESGKGNLAVFLCAQRPVEAFSIAFGQPAGSGHEP